MDRNKDIFTFTLCYIAGSVKCKAADILIRTVNLSNIEHFCGDFMMITREFLKLQYSSVEYLAVTRFYYTFPTPKII
jgi:hypothetical protein